MTVEFPFHIADPEKLDYDENERNDMFLFPPDAIICIKYTATFFFIRNVWWETDIYTLGLRINIFYEGGIIIMFIFVFFLSECLLRRANISYTKMENETEFVFDGLELYCSWGREKKNDCEFRALWLLQIT